MILVTGGTGLVGAHLLLSLAKQGKRIRATHRKSSNIDTVKTFFKNEGSHDLLNSIQWIEADITDTSTLHEAFKGISQVYHCAALISFDPNDYFKLKKVNIEGTANIVNLCVEHAIEKLCYVSSIAALGGKEEKTVTEKTEWDPAFDHNVYALSKYGAEMEVWRGTQEGLKAVIVNPGVILGTGFYDSGSGKLIAEVAKGFKYRLKGVSGYVDVSDVTACMLALMESDITNERFILVSENWAFEDFCDVMAQRLNKPSPKLVVKPWMLSLAWRLDWLKHLILRTKRTLPKQSARSALTATSYDSQKIRDRIGFSFIPVQESIATIARTLQG